MFNSDCIFKKIKSRFFKFFVNQYMIKFLNFINKNYCNENNQIFLYKIKTYFLDYANIKKHKEWKFLEKSILELFNDHSDTKLQWLVDIYTNDHMKFDKMMQNLDEITKFVVIEPFKVVFNRFINTRSLHTSFIEKVVEDLKKRMPHITQEEIDNYKNAFSKNLFNFVKYYD